jgi:ribonuclease HI
MQHEPVVAEALGALVATELSRDLGLRDIELEGDSLLVVNAIKDSGTQWSSYGHIVGDVRYVLNNMRSWEIGHVKHGANGAAHDLAKEAGRHARGANMDGGDTNLYFRYYYSRAIYSFILESWDSSCLLSFLDLLI